MTDYALAAGRHSPGIVAPHPGGAFDPADGGPRQRPDRLHALAAAQAGRARRAVAPDHRRRHGASTCRRRRSASKCSAAPARRPASIWFSCGPRSNRPTPVTRRGAGRRAQGDRADFRHHRRQRQHAAARRKRFKSIYPRYVVPGPAIDMAGLQVRAFRSGTPYQGEDLIYDPAAPARLLMRCTQSFAATPGTCLHERRLGSADITVRFPRDWLSDWRAIADGIDRLIARLRPAGG